MAFFLQNGRRDSVQRLALVLSDAQFSQRQRIYACRSAVTICIPRQSVDENSTSVGFPPRDRDVRVDGEGAVIALTQNADC